MPDDHDKDVYPEPPRRTPVVDKKTVLPSPTFFVTNIFYYVVDVPVSTFRDAIDNIRSRNKYYYYHRRFRRVPLITECLVEDTLCHFEAQMQWKRDLMVDHEIIKVMQERIKACQQREGNSYIQNCAKELQQFKEVSSAFLSRYGDLGAYGNARKCLMKQKARMIEEQKNA